MLKTPVAFIVFNRPDVTSAVFERIAQARPERLLVIADGPRKPEEYDACQLSRKIATAVDWACEVLTNFSDTNLGCKRRVATGLDWVFEQVEEAIVLEDDCVPDPTFFEYCETLLHEYRDDTRVMAISGDQFVGAAADLPSSYLFSEQMHVWGWASWRRAWKLYDVDMATWPAIRDAPGFALNRRGRRVMESFQPIFDKQYRREVDTWDYQWHYACLANSGLIILPTRNLVTNIGHRSDATHTTDEGSQFANLPAFPMEFPLAAPVGVFPATQIDDEIVRISMPKPPSVAARVKGRLRRMLRINLQ